MSGKRFESVEARSGRVVVGRLLPGADLMEGLEAVCDEHKIAFAAIEFAYGSLSSARFKFLQRPEGGRAVLVEHAVDARVEFIAGQGLVCEDGHGRRATHLHGAISDDTGTVFGGHFVPGGNPIYNNLDFMLVELVGVRLVREHDPETDTVEMRLERIE